MSTFFKFFFEIFFLFFKKLTKFFVVGLLLPGAFRLSIRMGKQGYIL